MNNTIPASARPHYARIKAMPCGVCGAPAPSEAHHIVQGQHWTIVPLCPDCHRGSHNGIHGQRRIWKVRKWDEIAVLNNTIKELMK